MAAWVAMSPRTMKCEVLCTDYGLFVEMYVETGCFVDILAIVSLSIFWCLGLHLCPRESCVFLNGIFPALVLSLSLSFSSKSVPYPNTKPKPKPKQQFCPRNKNKQTESNEKARKVPEFDY